MIKKYSYITSIILIATSLWGKSQPVLPLLSSVFSSNKSNQKITDNNIKICAIRVSFLPDVNAATTGTGGFLLEEQSFPEACESMQVDPPPHDKTYFRDHIKALSNYYYHVSRGKLVIDTLNSAVYPQNDTAAFRLPNRMAYYHPFLKEDSVDIRLAELFRDAVVTADESVDFSLYDVVVIFHAGVGQDFNITLDPTPRDIPSAYLNQQDLSLVYSNEIPFSGIPVEDATHHITDGIILPETQNHLYYDNWQEVFGEVENPCDYQIGLNGTFALMMGFYLGLPALFDTETGASGIGKFGLMDQGSSNLNGLIPALPCAWSRTYMGWVEPHEAHSSQELCLKHAEANSDTLMWRVPINMQEYFLVENRYSFVRPGVTLDSIQYRIYEENNKQEWPSVIPLIKDSIGAVFSERSGVLLSVPRYDVGLPGSGLLIWHIDDAIIEAGLATNRVNREREIRGVDLEEGDGAQDIGYTSQIFGANVDIGWFFDPWFAGNEGFWDLNPDYPENSEDRVGFNDYTHPSSRTNDGAYSGIAIDSIGAAGQIMNFRIQRNFAMDGYPISTTLTTQYLPLPIDVDVQDAFSEFVIIGDSIYVYRSDGSLQKSAPYPGIYQEAVPVFTTHEQTQYLAVLNKGHNGDGRLFYWEILDSYDIEFLDSLVLTDIEITSNPVFSGSNIIFAGKHRTENSYELVEYNLVTGDISYYDLTAELNNIAFAAGELYATQAGGYLLQIRLNPFEILEKVDLPDTSCTDLVTGYINANSDRDALLSSGRTLYLITDTGTDHANIKSYQLATPCFKKILSDIDGDGRVEILIAEQDKISALNENLVVEENFPIKIPNYYTGRFNLNLVTSDISSDGILDIIAGIDPLGVVAYDGQGNLLSSFPRPMAAAGERSATLLNDSLGLLYISSDKQGNIRGIKISEESLSDNNWQCFGGSGKRTFHYPVLSAMVPVSNVPLLNKKKIYNWPNPVKGDNITRIRYFPNKACAITIEIYDIAGDFITSFRDNQPLVNDYNERAWRVSSASSGVYFAVVRAQRGGQEESKIVKIMVIK